MSDIESLRADLQQVLQRIERWLGECDSAWLDTQVGGLPDLAKEIGSIRHLRARAASALINVALLGAFSSGKTFLLSGLQGGLELTKVKNDRGRVDDKYVGLLPSSPNPTTACPATVVPVDGSDPPDTPGRGFLRVRFIDSNEWEEIGYSPESKVVAAYAKAEPTTTDRLDRHWYRGDVAEIEILLSKYVLPAKLYDLPGYGSSREEHEKIMLQAMVDADCFIYVAGANRVLDEKDLKLIGELYQDYLSFRKPVVWVLTAIDRADELGLDDRPNWMTTRDTNNAYLRNNFMLPDGHPDSGFIGRGFIAVSPAFEARGKWLVAAGNTDDGEEMLARSRMDELRSVLTALIDAGTGQSHITAVAREARTIIIPRYRALTQVFAAHSLPLNQLRTQQEVLGKQLQSLQGVTDATLSRLETMFGSHMRTIERRFQGLAAHLHAELDTSIRSVDLLETEQAHGIEVRRKQLISNWLIAPKGPEAVANRELELFRDQVFAELRTWLDETHVTMGAAPISVDDLIMPPSRQSEFSSEDIVEWTKRVVTIAAPMVTTAAALHIALTAAVPPLGFALGGLLVFRIISVRKRRAEALDKLRSEWIEDLDKAARDLRESFLISAAASGKGVITRADELLAERCHQLVGQISIIKDRVAQPEHSDRQNLVDRLGLYCQEGENLISSLERLA